MQALSKTFFILDQKTNNFKTSSTTINKIGVSAKVCSFLQNFDHTFTLTSNLGISLTLTTKNCYLS